jgi:hypothetical protein
MDRFNIRVGLFDPEDPPDLIIYVTTYIFIYFLYHSKKKLII